MAYDDILTVLRRHGKAILWFVVSATAAAMMLTYVIPETFESTALVLVRPQKTIHLTSASADKELLNFPATGGTDSFQTTSQTYGEIIKSRVIIEEVVRRLGLDAEKQGGSSWWTSVKKAIKALPKLLKHGRIEEQSIFEKTVDTVMESISVKPTKDSFVFEITYTADDDPKEATAVANTAAKDFVEYGVEANRKEAAGSRELIEAQLAESNQKLETTRRNVRTFKEVNRLASLDESLSIDVRSLADFERTLEETGTAWPAPVR